eukprot:scaffold159639_cov36-Cyclotella_meneghiniana.AAC.1
MACDPVKQCQMCYYNRDGDNDTGTVCRCLVCNMYLCNKCYVKWHPKMEPSDELLFVSIGLVMNYMRRGLVNIGREVVELDGQSWPFK